MNLKLIYLIFIFSWLQLSSFQPAYADNISSPGKTPIRLQLKWKHQFQFAGYYAALEKGYYKEAGFNVKIFPATPSTDPIDTVLNGNAEFGVAASELVLRYANGDPVVALAAIFQHSPLTLFVREKSGINTIHDLVGHKVALVPSEAEILAYLKRENVPVNRIQIIQHDFSLDGLLHGKIDALAGYETDETYTLNQLGVKYLQFTPRSSGVDFYGDTLFTTLKMTEEHPEIAEAFRAASLRGWEYALSNVEEISALIHNKYAPDISEKKLQSEGNSMIDFVRSDLVEIGHMYIGRWQHILDVYRELGLISEVSNINISGIVYRTAKKADYSWLLWALLICAIVILMISGFTRRFYLLSKLLQQQLIENQKLQEEMNLLVITDPLTKLYNRRQFDYVLNAEWERLRREQKPLAILFIDLDYFKSYNDTYGHRAGDDCLIAIGKAISKSLLRPADLAARYGGEEFLILLPDTDTEGALHVARRVMENIEALCIWNNASAFGQITASIGMANQVPTFDQTALELMDRADRALYSAKQAGRNRIMVT
jgi:diguanylate cyclase (GGDEF)-like protein